MAHQRLRFPEPAPRRGRSLPPVLRDRERLPVLLGAAVAAIGALLPWLHAYRPGYDWYDVSGFEQSGDGGLVLELTIVAALIVWSDRTWRSRFGLVKALPALIGAVNVVVMRLSYVNFQTLLRELERAGGQGTLQPGFWLTVAGAAIMAVAGSVALWRARNTVTFGLSVSLEMLTGTIGGVGGGVGGFIVGTRIAGLLTVGAIAGVSTSVLIFLAFILGFVGAWVGAVAGVGLGRAIRR